MRTPSESEFRYLRTNAQTWDQAAHLARRFSLAMLVGGHPIRALYWLRTARYAKKKAKRCS